jgi:hypothetical protein
LGGAEVRLEEQPPDGGRRAQGGQRLGGLPALLEEPGQRQPERLPEGGDPGGLAERLDGLFFLGGSGHGAEGGGGLFLGERLAAGHAAELAERRHLAGRGQRSRERAYRGRRRGGRGG